MKALILAAAVLGSVSFAQADVVNPSAYTCAALQQLVIDSSPGGVQISQFIGSQTYYASSSCGPNEMSNSAYVAGTQDKTFCLVGYVCTPYNSNGGN